MGIYNCGGMKVARIQANNEFRAVLDPICMSITHIYKITYQKLNVTTVQSRKGSVPPIIILPYTTLTKTMVKVLVTEICQEIEFFLAKYGVSNYYSPHMILH